MLVAVEKQRDKWNANGIVRGKIYTCNDDKTITSPATALIIGVATSFMYRISDSV
jgi:hypothetical protein